MGWTGSEWTCLTGESGARLNRVRFAGRGTEPGRSISDGRRRMPRRGKDREPASDKTDALRALMLEGGVGRKARGAMRDLGVGSQIGEEGGSEDE